MAKNISTKETTLKSMLSTMSNDIWTIDKTLFYCNYDDKAIIQSGTILDDYYDYFQKFLIDVDVPEEYFYSPSYFSEVMYGTPDLDFLILYFANITSLFEFDRRKIKFLPKGRLAEINQLITAKKDEVANSYKNPTKI